MNERLKDFQISPADIAATYVGGTASLERYREHYPNVVARNIRPADFARRYGPTHSNDYKREQKWAKRVQLGNPPKPVPQLWQLHDYGLFPTTSPNLLQPEPHILFDALADFDANNPHFELIALLCAVHHSSGSTRKVRGRQTFNMETLKRSNDQQRATFLPLVEHLAKRGWLASSEVKNKSKFMMRPEMALARLLHLANEGAWEDQRQRPFPHLFELAENSLDAKERREALLARSLMMDFMQVYLSLNGTKEGAFYRVRLPGQASPELANVCAESYMAVLKALGWDADLKQQSTINKKTGDVPVLRLNQAKVHELQDDMGRRVKEIIS